MCFGEMNGSVLLFTSSPSSPLSPVHASVPRSSCDAAAGAHGVLAGEPVPSGARAALPCRELGLGPAGGPGST